jgi:hypothetical protein
MVLDAGIITEVQTCRAKDSLASLLISTVAFCCVMSLWSWEGRPVSDETARALVVSD